MSILEGPAITGSLSSKICEYRLYPKYADAISCSIVSRTSFTLLQTLRVSVKFCSDQVLFCV